MSFKLEDLKIRDALLPQYVPDPIGFLSFIVVINLIRKEQFKSQFWLYHLVASFTTAFVGATTVAVFLGTRPIWLTMDVPMVVFTAVWALTNLFPYDVPAKLITKTPLVRPIIEAIAEMNKIQVIAEVVDEASGKIPHTFLGPVVLATVFVSMGIFLVTDWKTASVPTALAFLFAAAYFVLTRGAPFPTGAVTLPTFPRALVVDVLATLNAALGFVLALAAAPPVAAPTKKAKKA
eukprot:CAMPEP_0196662136 /NCGR_PEP_ID=MMETSP1086-20130531/47370_1 /TAXON_ID=77921 /ORGANISM="Cyanoptyche  gloeocystis , Strain SAG4.97" /LENGTH=234 /DNA_ID=CAMNT_0041997359 /DNA_START=102 /DNA_END=806 /DNA_ORIENTATION=-